MGFDAARRNILLFGGFDGTRYLNDTWTWDGAMWTKHAPAASPPGRDRSGLVYDAARAEVLLFGGLTAGGVLGDTWMWDGTTWTQELPATSPPARSGEGIADDVTGGDIVLFGGYGGNGQGDLADTWTWNGSTWAQRFPATSPSGREETAMADDAAGGDVMLFGGTNQSGLLGDTWLWSGTTWTEERPSASPPARYSMSLAEDTANDQVVLFGGTAPLHRDTWTWDGVTWTERSPGRSPSARDGMGMAYDPVHAEVVLFGGYGPYLGDTWSWDGTTWRVPFVPTFQDKPSSGPPGTLVAIKGSGFAAFEAVKISFHDPVNGTTLLTTTQSGADGAVTASVTIPSNAAAGAQRLKASGSVSGQRAMATFTVT